MLVRQALLFSNDFKLTNFQSWNIIITVLMELLHASWSWLFGVLYLDNLFLVSALQSNQACTILSYVFNLVFRLWLKTQWLADKLSLDVRVCETSILSKSFFCLRPVVYDGHWTRNPPKYTSWCRLTNRRGSVHYLKEDVGRVMQTHDQCASSYHVVSIGECDEQYGG